MAKRQWSKALTAMLVLVGGFSDVAFARGSGNTRQPELTTLIRLDNRAGVDPWIVEYAEKRTNEVFALIGVRVEWIDGADANARKIIAPYNVMLMASAPAEVKAAAEGLGDSVMGQGAPSIHRSYIYYDRILPKILAPRDIVSTLGDVIAHELGHLMLPPGHSGRGIMRPQVAMESRILETFTDAEAKIIRKTIAHPADARGMTIRSGGNGD